MQPHGRALANTKHSSVIGQRVVRHEVCRPFRGLKHVSHETPTARTTLHPLSGPQWNSGRCTESGSAVESRTKTRSRLFNTSACSRGSPKMGNFVLIHDVVACSSEHVTGLGTVRACVPKGASVAASARRRSPSREWDLTYSLSKSQEASKPVPGTSLVLSCSSGCEPAQASALAPSGLPATSRWPSHLEGDTWDRRVPVIRSKSRTESCS